MLGIAVVAAALCLPALLQAQDKKKTGERYGYRNNELPRIFGALRIRHYEDTVTQADWDRSGGKPVPLVRLLAVKQAAKR